MKIYLVLIFFLISLPNFAFAQCIGDPTLTYEIKIEDENILKSNLEIKINKNEILDMHGLNIIIETKIISCQGSYIYYSKNENVDKININLIQEPHDICEFLIISKIFVDNKKIDTYKKYFFIEKTNISNIYEDNYLDVFKNKKEIATTYSNINQNEEAH